MRFGRGAARAWSRTASRLNTLRSRSSRPAGARRRHRANEDALGMMPDAPPVKRRRILRASRSIAVLTACALAAGGPARAQDIPKGVPLIRDAETEQLLREYTQPI